MMSARAGSESLRDWHHDWNSFSLNMARHHGEALRPHDPLAGKERQRLPSTADCSVLKDDPACDPTADREKHAAYDGANCRQERLPVSR